ncbi:hypothetical protein MTYP_01329 [Methylophilaceae bacterium]|nr:hypothetical protein MTYP_01329 [Methylophilaceae bacterium]
MYQESKCLTLRNSGEHETVIRNGIHFIQSRLMDSGLGMRPSRNGTFCFVLITGISGIIDYIGQKTMNSSEASWSFVVWEYNTITLSIENC